MSTNPLGAAMFPNLTRNEGALTALGKQLSAEDNANLRTITKVDFERPESTLGALPRMEKLLAENPNAVQNMANMPPQIRSAALADAAQKENANPGSGFAVLESIARGETPGQAPATPTSPQAAATDPAQTAAPTSATPGDAAASSTPPAGTPAAQGPDLMKSLMDSNPQMAGMFSRFTEVMQGLMGRLMTGLLGFIGKIFSGMDGSGGNLFAASNNPASNNLGNALAIGGADRHMPLSLQIGDESPRDTRVSDLQKPASAPPTLDGPTNRPGQNGPQFDPGTA